MMFHRVGEVPLAVVRGNRSAIALALLIASISVA